MRVAARCASILIGAVALGCINTPAADAAVSFRIAGADRYATARDIVFAGGQGVWSGPTYIASGTGFADALAAGPAAAATEGGSIALTSPDRLRTEAKEAALGSGDVILVGGETALTPRVENELRAAGASVRRVAGHDRYETAARISGEVFKPGVPVVYLASGESFPDALAAGPAAAKQGGPVLLTRKGLLPDETRAEIARLKPQRVVIMGGHNSVSTEVEASVKMLASTERVAGSDRYETAAAVAARVFDRPAKAYLASGEDFPDALAGGPLAAHHEAPILLVRRGAVPAAVCQELGRLDPTTIIALGGPVAISDEALSRAGSLCRTAPAPRGELNGGVSVNGRSMHNIQALLDALGPADEVSTGGYCEGTNTSTEYRWQDFTAFGRAAATPVQSTIVGWAISPYSSGDPERHDGPSTGPLGVRIGTPKDVLWRQFGPNSEVLEWEEHEQWVFLPEGGNRVTFWLADFFGPVTYMYGGDLCE